MLKLYCSKVGIAFEQSMIDWNETQQQMKVTSRPPSHCSHTHVASEQVFLQVFKDWLPWFEGVLTSSTFTSSDTRPKSPMKLPDLPPDVQRCIDECMPVYNEMHAVRLTLPTLQQ